MPLSDQMKVGLMIMGFTFIMGLAIGISIGLNVH